MINYYYTEFIDKNRNVDYDEINDSAEDIVSKYLSVNDISLTDSNSIGRLTYYLMKLKKIQFDDFDDAYIIVEDIVAKINHLKAFNNFKQVITSPKSANNSLTIDDIDLMTGIEFENCVSEIFIKIGYLTQITKASGDQGIDVIAEKNGSKIGVQAKCYSGTVGNTAIQEAVAGKKYYNCDKVVVVTNSTFTQSAIDLANANNVVLWDRNILKEKLI